MTGWAGLFRMVWVGRPVESYLLRLEYAVGKGGVSPIRGRHAKYRSPVQSRRCPLSQLVGRLASLTAGETIKVRPHLHDVDHVIFRVIVEPREWRSTLEFLWQEDRLTPVAAAVRTFENPGLCQHQLMPGVFAEDRTVQPVFDVGQFLPGCSLIGCRDQ